MKEKLSIFFSLLFLGGFLLFVGFYNSTNAAYTNPNPPGSNTTPQPTSASNPGNNYCGCNGCRTYCCYNDVSRSTTCWANNSCTSGCPVERGMVITPAPGGGGGSGGGGSGGSSGPTPTPYTGAAQPTAPPGQPTPTPVSCPLGWGWVVCGQGDCIERGPCCGANDWNCTGGYSEGIEGWQRCLGCMGGGGGAQDIPPPICMEGNYAVTTTAFSKNGERQEDGIVVSEIVATKTITEGDSNNYPNITNEYYGIGNVSYHHLKVANGQIDNLPISSHSLYLAKATLRLYQQGEGMKVRFFPFTEGYLGPEGETIAVYKKETSKNTSKQDIQYFTPKDPFLIMAGPQGLRFTALGIDGGYVRVDQVKLVKLKTNLDGGGYYFDPSIQRFRADIIAFGGVPNEKKIADVYTQKYFYNTRYLLWDFGNALLNKEDAENYPVSAYGQSLSPLEAYPFQGDGTRYLYYEFENAESERSGVCSPIQVNLPSATCSLSFLDNITPVFDEGVGNVVYPVFGGLMRLNLKAHGPAGTDNNIGFLFVRSYTYAEPSAVPKLINENNSTEEDFNLAGDYYYYNDNASVVSSSNNLVNKNLTVSLPYDSSSNAKNYYVVFCGVSSQESPDDNSLEEDMYYCFNDPDLVDDYPEFACNATNKISNPTPVYLVRVERSTSFPEFKIQGYIKEFSSTNSCSVAKGLSSDTVSLTVTPDIGSSNNGLVSTNCTLTSTGDNAGFYTCTITIDSNNENWNENEYRNSNKKLSIIPNLGYIDNKIYPNYDNNIKWAPATPSCNRGDDNVFNIDLSNYENVEGSVTFGRDITYEYNTDDIGGGGNVSNQWWFKVIQGMFVDTKRNENPIPYGSVSKIDANYDPGNKVALDAFSENKAGFFAHKSPYNLYGGDFAEYNTAFSALQSSSFDISGYINKVAGRQGFEKINNSSEITGGEKAYLYEGSSTIALPNGKNNYLLVVPNATVEINSNFNSGSNIVILANKVTIKPTVNRLEDVFIIANEAVIEGSGTNESLLVVGNFVVNNLNVSRKISDYKKPLLAIYFKPDLALKYLEFLGFVKTASYIE